MAMYAALASYESLDFSSYFLGVVSSGSTCLLHLNVLSALLFTRAKLEITDLVSVLSDEIDFLSEEMEYLDIAFEWERNFQQIYILFIFATS